MRLADGPRASRSSTTLFSCNNAITGPGTGDTGGRGGSGQGMLNISWPGRHSAW